MGKFMGRCTHSKNKRSGLAMAELIMMLLVLGLLSAGVAGLFGQLSLFSKKSTQAGTFMELRSKVSSLNQNSEKWLNVMRAKYALYSACIPDSKTATYLNGTFNCPVASTSYEDTGLEEIAASQLAYTKAPIVDLMGDLIAGGDTPLYLTDSGRPCEGSNQESRCPLKSTGYMLRSNPSTSANPGDIRFVVKIEKNNLAQNAGTIFKPIYLTVELGRSWQDGSGVKDKTVKIGYLNDGEPMVLDPKHKCADGEYYVGSDAKGEQICKSFPSCPEGSGAALTSVNSDLVCMSSSPCAAGQVHMGFYAGTGKPICTAPNPTCANETIQTGISEAGQAECKALPACDATQIVSFNGNEFGCVANVGLNSCPEGKLLSGFNADGTAKCEDKRGIASGDQTCPSGQYSAGVDASGNVVCKQLFAFSDTGGFSCSDGEYVSGLQMTEGGLVPECAKLPGVVTPPVEPVALPPITYKFYARGPGGALRGYDSRDAVCAFLKTKDALAISGAECSNTYPRFVVKGKCGRDYYIQCASR